MKTLGRILIILMAASIVIGATYALSQTALVSGAGRPTDGPGEPKTDKSTALSDFANGQACARRANARRRS